MWEQFAIFAHIMQQELKTQNKVITMFARFSDAGLGKRLSRAVMALVKSGIKVEYISAFPPDLSHELLNFHTVKTPGIFVRKSPDHRSPLFWAHFFIAAGCYAARAARRKEVQCLMAFSFGAAFPMILARVLSRKPLIIFLRSNERQEIAIKKVALPLRLVFGFLERCVASLSTQMITVSDSLAETLRTRYPRVANKISVLYNDLPTTIGCDRQSARKEVALLVGREDAFVFSTSARFDKRKNAGILIKAMAKISDDRAMLLLVGDGPAIPELKHLAKTLCVGDRVVFAGWRNDPATLVKGTDLFLLPSLAEGMSNSLLEAFASETACLASSIPEHIEIFGSGEALFDPGSPNEVTEKMNKIVADSAYRGLIDKISTDAAKRFSFNWDARLLEIMRIYGI